MTFWFILATLVVQPILLYWTFHDTTPEGRKNFFNSMPLVQTAGLVCFILVFSFFMAALVVGFISLFWPIVLACLGIFLLGLGITILVRRYA